MQNNPSELVFKLWIWNDVYFKIDYHLAQSTETRTIWNIIMPSKISRLHVFVKYAVFISIFWKFYLNLKVEKASFSKIMTEKTN